MKKLFIHPVSYLATAIAVAFTAHSPIAQSRTRNMIPCTPSIEPGITVKVFDAKTQKPLVAKVTVQEGKYQEQLGPFETTTAGQVIYGGAFERPGRYTVAVTQPGYQPVVMPPIAVTKDACHVITQRLAVRLQPIIR